MGLALSVVEVARSMGEEPLHEIWNAREYRRDIDVPIGMPDYRGRKAVVFYSSREAALARGTDAYVVPLSIAKWRCAELGYHLLIVVNEQYEVIRCVRLLEDPA